MALNAMVSISSDCGCFDGIYFIIMLPDMTKVSVGIWLVIGLVTYFVYGIRHSKLQQRQNKNNSS